MELVEHDRETGTTRTLLRETSEKGVLATSGATDRTPPAILRGRGEVVVWSERDDWGHLWVHELESGEPLRQLTSGPWLVRDILHVDERSGLVWFSAAGREPGRNPYRRLLYRVSLDGGAPELLADEDLDHHLVAGPDGRLLLDTMSTPSEPPRFVVRDLDGTVIRDLGTTDVSELDRLGWRRPEAFSVELDGVGLHGLLFYPCDFDPSGSYPLVDDIYCANLNGVPIGFPRDGAAWEEHDYWAAQALAETGVVVMKLDGRGGPMRGRDFRLPGFYVTVDDHAAVAELLTAERSSLDAARIGIHGHSAGGFLTVLAMLDHPSVFKAGVSSAGSLVSAGTPFEAAHEPLRVRLVDRAAELEGELLLVYGDLDEIVTPISVTRMVDALIRAEKDFDLLLMPNQGHAYVPHPYFLRRLFGHFTRHLLGAAPPRDFRFSRDLEFERRLRYVEVPNDRWDFGDLEEAPPQQDEP